MYKNFAFMMAISFVVMYSVMFLNVVELDHVYLSLTRFYMSLLMIAPMVLIMLGFMGKMYRNKKLNRILLGSAVLVFVGAWIGLRTQTPISDIQYMKAMIPHHSSAILTSERARIKDPEVRKLADDIIAAQKKEIAEMKAMMKKIESDR